MRAAYYENNGAARDVLRVGEVATPESGHGEVRVKLATSGVNPSDVKARDGHTRKIAFPQIIPHSDGAGVIDQVGDGVSPALIGERVWTWNAQWQRAFGTAAEYVVLPETMAVRLPDQISFEAGACLGIPAMTAQHAIAVSEASEGTALLISGGAGSVANYAIQFAKARGASVLTTVSSEAKAKLALDAGADHVIDYKREDVGARIKDLTGGQGVDAVIELDLAANAHLLPQVLRPSGLVVIYGTSAATAELPAFFCLVNSIRLQFIFVYELTTANRVAAVSEITRMLEADQLVHNIAATYPLDDIVTAHEAVESGQVAGNVVMTIGRD